MKAFRRRSWKIASCEWGAGARASGVGGSMAAYALAKTSASPSMMAGARPRAGSGVASLPVAKVTPRMPV